MLNHNILFPFCKVDWSKGTFGSVGSEWGVFILAEIEYRGIDRYIAPYPGAFNSSVSTAIVRVHTRQFLLFRTFPT